MRILVLSDSHGNVENMARCVELTQPNAILHLGDWPAGRRGSAPALSGHPSAGRPGQLRLGRCGQPRGLTEYGGVRILLMHGHTRSVKASTLSAIYAAKEMGAQILLFGHTHRPLVDYDGSLWVMNPGTIGRGNPCTYGIITISGGQGGLLHLSNIRRSQNVRLTALGAVFVSAEYPGPAAALSTDPQRTHPGGDVLLLYQPKQSLAYGL